MRARVIAVWLVAFALVAAEAQARGGSGRGGGNRGGIARGSFGRTGSSRGVRSGSQSRTSRPAARPVTRSYSNRSSLGSKKKSSSARRGTTQGSTSTPRYRAPSRGRWGSSRYSTTNRSRTSSNARTTRGASSPTRSSRGKPSADRTSSTRTRGLFTQTGRAGSGRTSGLSTRDYLTRRYNGGSGRARGADRGARGQQRNKQTEAGYGTRGRGYETIADRQGKRGVTRIGARARYYGGYCGGYYNPWRRRYCGFYYPNPVSCCYVPYGFYGGSTTIYIDGSAGVSDEYVVERYETVKNIEQSADDASSIEAAAGSAAAERYMREATELFTAGEYPEAARRFRLAAIAAPEQSGPLFAMGQSLIALGNYPYAAKVIRRAIDLEPTIVNEGADLVGVYASREEFDRVTAALVAYGETRPDDLHAPFLLGVQQYFSGDPAARETLSRLVVANRSDRISAGLLAAAERRFKASEDLPPIDAK